MPLAYGLTESVDLCHPAVPTAFPSPPRAIPAAKTHPRPSKPTLGSGLRIAHLTDLHVRKPTKRLDRLVNQLAKLRLDLGLLTGDYMIRHRDPAPALRYLRELTQAVKPAHGWFGVFGNHDTPEFIKRAQELPIHWMIDQATALETVPVDILGLGRPGPRQRPDGTAASLAAAALPDPAPGQPQRLRLALTHRPDDLPLAADLGAHLAFAGHTHGGQVRILPGVPIYTSTDLPLSLSAGLLRHQDTLMLIPRGVGSTDLFKLPIYPRLFCKPHAPVVTLRHGPLPATHTDSITAVWRW